MPGPYDADFACNPAGACGGLRLWENDDIVPRPDDVFQERLYCIRWRRRMALSRSGGEQVALCAPTAADLEREERVLALLRERFHVWQEKGYIPTMRIEPGDNTDQPIREGLDALAPPLHAATVVGAGVIWKRGRKTYLG
jgi:hypothetical protein